MIEISDSGYEKELPYMKSLGYKIIQGEASNEETEHILGEMESFYFKHCKKLYSECGMDFIYVFVESEFDSGKDPQKILEDYELDDFLEEYYRNDIVKGRAKIDEILMFTEVSHIMLGVLDEEKENKIIEMALNQKNYAPIKITILRSFGYHNISELSKDVNNEGVKYVCTTSPEIFNKNEPCQLFNYIKVKCFCEGKMKYEDIIKLKEKMEAKDKESEHCLHHINTITKYNFWDYCFE